MEKKPKKGYPRDLFLNGDQIEQLFLCKACDRVLREPKLLYPCKHVVCDGCYQDLKPPKTCPWDRKLLTWHRKTDPPLDELVKALEIWCPYKDNGCTRVLLLGDLKDHKWECEFNPKNQLECERGCGAILNQEIRRTETHNCGEYWKQKFIAEETEHKATKVELLDCRPELEALKAGYSRTVVLVDKDVKTPTVTRPLPNEDDERDSDMKEEETTNSPPRPQKRSRFAPTSCDPVPISVICTRKWNVNEGDFVYRRVLFTVHRIADFLELESNPGYHMTREFSEIAHQRVQDNLSPAPSHQRFQLISIKWVAKYDRLEHQQQQQKYDEDDDEDSKADVGITFDVGDEYWVHILLSRAASR